MSKFVLSIKAKAKADLIKIARYTQLTWGIEQRNCYLTLLDNAFHQIAEQPKLGVNCDYIRAGYRKYFQGSHVIYFKENQTQILIVRILHKMCDS